MHPFLDCAKPVSSPVELARATRALSRFISSGGGAAGATTNRFPLTPAPSQSRCYVLYTLYLIIFVSLLSSTEADREESIVGLRTLLASNPGKRTRKRNLLKNAGRRIRDLDAYGESMGTLPSIYRTNKIFSFPLVEKMREEKRIAEI